MSNRKEILANIRLAAKKKNPLPITTEPQQQDVQTTPEKSPVMKRPRPRVSKYVKKAEEALTEAIVAETARNHATVELAISRQSVELVATELKKVDIQKNTELQNAELQSTMVGYAAEQAKKQHDLTMAVMSGEIADVKGLATEDKEEEPTPDQKRADKRHAAAQKIKDREVEEEIAAAEQEFEWNKSIKKRESLDIWYREQLLKLLQDHQAYMLDCDAKGVAPNAQRVAEHETSLQRLKDLKINIQARSE